jgi:Flp pilus assembly protein CpaB
MEASSVGKIGGKSPRDLFSSRRGTTLIAVGAAVLAGILLFAFVQSYRNSVNSTAASTSVFVASSYIPRGASASLIASGQLLQRTTVKSNAVKAGAITDPSVLHGEVAATDIYPGQQLTAADFTVAGGTTIASDLTGTDRAIAVPVDSAHGLVGFVRAGDRIDVYSSFAGTGARGAVTPLAQNVLVLSAPGGGGAGVVGGGGAGGNIVLRVSTKIAQQLAYIADNGKVWITLRPPVGAVNSAGSSAPVAH